MTDVTHEQLAVARDEAPEVARGVLTALALVGVLCIGAFFRFSGLDWDEGHHLHPDERFLSLVESAMEPVGSVSAYFDTPNSSLNPNNRGYGFFVYGDFPIILAQYVGRAVDMYGYGDITLVGRALSAGFDVATIVLIFLTGRQVYSWRAGLLGGLLYALAAFPIQQSHFFTVDAFATTLVAAAVWLAARLLERHRWPDYALFGLALGLSVASKITVFPLAGLLVLAVTLREWPRIAQVGGLEATLDQPESRRRLWHALAGLALAGVVTFAVFRVAMPYAFLPPGSGATSESVVSRLLAPTGLGLNPDWVEQMRTVRYYVSGEWDAPPNHQWASRPRLIFPWLNMVRFGMGWPLGLSAWLGFVWATWEIARRHRGWRHHLLLVAWSGLFFAWQGSGWVMSMRYLLPIYPHLILLGAWSLVTVWERVRDLLRERGLSARAWPAVVSAGVMGVVVLGTAAWGFAFSRIYSRPVTRVAASDWLYENLPGDVTFTLETDAGPLNYHLGLPNSWIPSGVVFDETLAPEARYTLLAAGTPRETVVRLPTSGRLTGLRLNHVADVEGDANLERLNVRLRAENGDALLLEATVADSFRPAPDDERGRSYEVSFEPVEVSADVPYLLTLEAVDGSLALAGGSIAAESAWDDALPLSRGEYDPWGTQFHGYKLELFWEDTPDKRQHMAYVLDRADVIVITSNRLYDSLERIPSRWPMSLDYYRALFDGELGFEMVADFTSYPNLGPLRFPDQSAEEAFSVYDHPRVVIFRKTEAYSSDNTARILGQADLEAVTPTRADVTTDRPIDLDPPRLAQRQGQASQKPARPARTEAEAAGPLNTIEPLGVVVWWLLIVAVGWLAFPILFVALPGLPDRGYPVAKIFGLLFAAWLGWMLASLKLVAWSGLTVAATLAALGGLAFVVARHSRDDLLAFVRNNRKHLLVVEGLTLLLFVAFLLVRLGNPDLWHPIYGGEKPMDFAYFNAVLKSDTFPPYDPWFAGSTINYYYFGFVLVGVPVKLLGILPSFAYNLILPTLFALTGMGAFAAAYALSAPSPGDDGPRSHSPYLAGAAALLLAVALGNLDQIRTLLFALAQVGGYDPGYGYAFLPPLGAAIDGLALQLSQGGLLPVGLGEWYWNATRLIPVPLNEAGIATEPGPITEFPYFTFLYADLHAHMIAMPIGLLSLTWAIGQVRNAARRFEATLTSGPFSEAGLWALNLFVGGLAIGALRPTNTWDYPTYLALGVGALALAAVVQRGRLDGWAALNALWRGALLVGLTFVLFAPYLLSYESAYNAFDLWEGSRTPLWAYLDAHGLFLFVLVTFLVWETGAWLRAASTGGLARWRLGLRLLALLAGAALFGAAYLARIGYPAALAVLPLTLWAGVLFFRPGLDIGKRLALALLAVALALSFFVEVYVLRGGDIGRMNTVFKFYLQVWVLLSVAAGAALAWLWPQVQAWRPGLRDGWRGVLGFLTLLAALYPITATGAKVADRWSRDTPTTLDGMAYMPYVTRNENGQDFSLQADYDALQWLQANVTGHPVILEANTPEYRWGNRVSVYTGLPAVVGWNWHQRQQRSFQSTEAVTSRVSDVATLYATTDVGVTEDLLATYEVEYIIVGDLERAYFEPPGLAKFGQMVEDGTLNVVYDGGGTLIYQVVT